MKVLRDQNPTIEVYTEVVRTDQSENMEQAGKKIQILNTFFL